MAEIEDELHDDKIGFNEAREMIKSKQWRAERLNPGRYSPKQTVDMQVTDKTKLHLEAIRLLARQLPATQLPSRPAQPALTQVGPSVPTGTLEVIDVECVPVSVHSSSAALDTSSNT